MEKKLSTHTLSLNDLTFLKLNAEHKSYLPLRKLAIDGLSPEISGRDFFLMSFLREIYSGIDGIDRLRREFILQLKYSHSKLNPYFKPCLLAELSST